MKKVFRYIGIAVGTMSTLIVVTVMMLYIVGEHDLSSKGDACMASEDFVAVRSQLQEAMASGDIDQAIMDRERKNIARAKEYCVNGQMKESRTLLVNVMMDASILSDGVYERKLNAAKKEDDHGDPKNP
ncbi:hypothetical protein [Dyella psychrodurans]|uniref:Uncharacterized protein n=1 Tax=Dyella psychrodurans TaxID=1927960 RepID=A0A370X4X1_9GAMM|nr:hypothetical protein [Dyella psychrodurans]RDS83382.1 hypothetical protein DWU99_12670 [Dyella psychrodurans]